MVFTPITSGRSENIGWTEHFCLGPRSSVNCTLTTGELTANPALWKNDGNQILIGAGLILVLAVGSPVSAIGRDLCVSHNTVHSHVRSIYRKLGVSSRPGALERVRKLGLLQPVFQLGGTAGRWRLLTGVVPPGKS